MVMMIMMMLMFAMIVMISMVRMMSMTSMMISIMILMLWMVAMMIMVMIMIMSKFNFLHRCSSYNVVVSSTATTPTFNYYTGKCHLSELQANGKHSVGIDKRRGDLDENDDDDG